MCEKDYIWNSDACSCVKGKYVGGIIDDSLIMYDEIMDTTKSISTKTVPAKAVQTKTNLKIFYMLLSFLLINIVLLIAVSIYSYFMKYWAK